MKYTSTIRNNQRITTSTIKPEEDKYMFWDGKSFVPRSVSDMRYLVKYGITGVDVREEGEFCILFRLYEKDSEFKMATRTFKGKAEACKAAEILSILCKSVYVLHRDPAKPIEEYTGEDEDHEAEADERTDEC